MPCAQAEKIKGIILLSGGLDSVLAAHILTGLGAELTAIHFTSPFHPKTSGGKSSPVKAAAARLGMKLRFINLGEEIIEAIKEPDYGYGKNLNPCIDCRIRQLKIAKEILRKVGGEFIATGEVVEQRPMSQNRNSLSVVAKEAGAEGFLLRPLSARRLEPTEVEKKGLIERENLYSIDGRSRKEQFELAEKFNISSREYLPAAGGCRLTNREYARKVRDLKKHNILDMKNAKLLSRGRHLRISPEFKLIVGRDEKENNILEKEVPEDALRITPVEIPGPFAAGIGNFAPEEVKISAAVCAYYTDKKAVKEMEFTYSSRSGRGTIKTLPLTPEKIREYYIV
ncbi:MAG: hypothetical protein U9R36_03675 [Elusimicrobiota bacterium]|nr:hypothetical protein [Elusimicrobiota bacterium]